MELQTLENGLIYETGINKLPTDAAHNYLHSLSHAALDQAEKLNEQAKVFAILTALELEHIKTDNHGCPWKKWVSENCEFSYETARRYDRLLDAARGGMIEGFDPASLPEHAPSLMDAQELQEACIALSNGLQNGTTYRQLLLELDIIRKPSGEKTIADNRNTKGGPTKTKKLPDFDAREQEALEQFSGISRDLDDWSKVYLNDLTKSAAEQIVDTLKSYADQLKEVK